MSSPACRQERARYPALLEEIRAHGLSRVEGDLLRGVGGSPRRCSATHGAIVAALTAVGIQGSIDVRSERARPRLKAEANRRRTSCRSA